ncbi:MAG: hypothetical protein BWZ08_01199 [candidate division BRC1 bacterium ADurb.BinA292]|nr:MAG: hypothetical protein BWZ08_01199 [candidate division BRC1 bacterium ADurb.BinA292]
MASPDNRVHQSSASAGHAARGPVVWIITPHRTVHQRIERLLRPLPAEVVRRERVLEDPRGSARPKPRPQLVVLDVDEDMEQGARVIEALRRGRLDAPLIVLTRAFTRDFGARILSLGVRYYFSQDFCESEFREVVQSLLRLPASEV